MVSDFERTNRTNSPDEEGYEVVPPSRGKTPLATEPTPDTIAEDTMNLRIADDEVLKGDDNDKNGEKSRHRGQGGRRHHKGPGGYGGRHHRGFGGPPPPSFLSFGFQDPRGPPPGYEGYPAAFFGPPGFGPGGRGHKHKHRHARSYSPPGAGWEDYKSDAEDKGRRGKHHKFREGRRGHKGEGFGHGRKHGRRGHSKGREAAPEDEAQANNEKEKDIEITDVTNSSSETESDSTSGSESDLTPSDQERFDKFMRFHRRAFGKGHGKGPRGHPGFGGFGRVPPPLPFGFGHFGGDRRGHGGPACQCGFAGAGFGPRGPSPYEHFGRRGPPSQDFGFGPQGHGRGHGHGHGRRGPHPEFFRGEHDMRGPPPASDEELIGHHGFGGFGRHHRGGGGGRRGPRGFGREHHYDGPHAWGPDDA